MGNQISGATRKMLLSKEFALATKEVVLAYNSKSANLERKIDNAENIRDQIFIECEINTEKYLNCHLVPIIGLGVADNIVSICDNIISNHPSFDESDIDLLCSILEDIKSRVDFFEQ